MHVLMGTEPPGGPQYYGRDTSAPPRPTTGPGSDLLPPLTPPPVAPVWPPAPPTLPPSPADGARRWVALVVAIVLLAGFAGGGAWLTSRKHGPSYPKAWDSRVANLVSFVERTRGLHFEHPVEVDFVPESAFK